jgi:tRNA(Ile)-lysidine synthase
MLQARFDKCLEGLLPDGGAVLLAVSGGIDSMVMADLFVNSSLNPRIILAHCNFHLRGQESDGDADFVGEWAGVHGVRLEKADFDTNEYAAAHGISIEMAARELRYGWFASVCSEQGIKAVAVAHNANDNAESLILNLLRGTGLKGICGMKDSSPLLGDPEIRLIRPLLGFTREEIHEYALSRGVEWREDSTNADSAYKRNLIRNEIFPLFEKINPSFVETLNDDSRRFAQVQEVADDFVDCHLSEVLGGGNSIDVNKLKEAPHWEYLLFRLLEPYGFNEAVIEDLIALIREGQTFSGRRFHSKEYVAATTRNSIVVCGSDSTSPSCASRPARVNGRQNGVGTTGEGIVVEGPGKYSLDGAEFEVEVAEVEDPRQPEGTTVAAIGFPFTVRRWQPGDWMRPLGMGGRRKKLSDMFGDLKFSPEQKEKALVIADEGSHVLALLGYRIDESVALPALRPLRQAQGPQEPVIRIRLI